jgi:hypothetical protein
MRNVCHMKCPHCHTEATKVGAFWICPTHGQLSKLKSVTLLRSLIRGGRERYLIVIDALDEAGEAGRNPLVEMLARNAPRLPDWLGLVVTSRPEVDVKTPLQALNPFPLDTQSESNRADIRDYLRRELATQFQNRPDADHLVEQILEKSEGMFCRRGNCSMTTYSPSQRVRT